jgi:hypothetical protein
VLTGRLSELALRSSAGACRFITSVRSQLVWEPESTDAGPHLLRNHVQLAERERSGLDRYCSPGLESHGVQQLRHSPKPYVLAAS